MMTKNWQTFLVGFFFVLGFDMATEVAIFGVPAAQAVKGLGRLEPASLQYDRSAILWENEIVFPSAAIGTLKTAGEILTVAVLDRQLRLHPSLLRQT